MADPRKKQLLKLLQGSIYDFCRIMKFQPTWQQAELLGAVNDIVARLRSEIEPLMMAAQKAGLAGRQARKEELEQRAVEEVKSIIRRIAVRSGQGPGKTTVSCIVSLWWLFQWPGSRVILTAPSMKQCKNVFLAELKRVLMRGPKWVSKLIEVQTTQAGMCGHRPDIWGLISITATRSENAQGQHGTYMMVIGEEASGIEREIIEQFKGTLSNPLCILLLVGNPNTRDCAFFDCFTAFADRYRCIHWNGEETPPTPWFDPSRNEELAAEFGRESDIYRVRVLGEFPLTDPNCVVSEEDLLACTDARAKFEAMRRPLPGAAFAHQFGLDLARFGGDELVRARRCNSALADLSMMHRVDPSVLLDAAMAEQESRRLPDDDTIYVPDAGGVGQGSMQRLYDRNKQVHEFAFNGTPIKTLYYADKITEAYFHFAKLVRQKLIWLPFDRQLFEQLSKRQYGYSERKGKRDVMALESKKKYRERTKLGSPDRADAVVMAFYPAAPAEVMIGGDE